MTPLSKRDAEGNYTTISLHPTYVLDPTKEERGGGGLYGSTQDFIKILASLLDERLLKQETISEIFTPQLQDTDLFHKTVVVGDVPSPAFAVTEMFTNAALGSIPRKTAVNFGLGGIITLEDIEGARRSGSLSWSGLANCYWVSWQLILSNSMVRELIFLPSGSIAQSESVDVTAPTLCLLVMVIRWSSLVASRRLSIRSSGRIP